MSFTESWESFRVLSECHQRFIQFHSENYQRFIQFHSENYQRVIQRVMRVSENHQKVIRLSWKSSEIISRSSEGHHKVISRLSGGHQRVIRGSSGGHQKSIYFSSQICIALKLFWFQVSFQKLFWALMIFFLLFFSSTSPSMVAAAAAYTNMWQNVFRHLKVPPDSSTGEVSSQSPTSSHSHQVESLIAPQNSDSEVTNNTK